MIHPSLAELDAARHMLAATMRLVVATQSEACRAFCIETSDKLGALYPVLNTPSPEAGAEK